MSELPNNRDGCGVDVAAYALGALDPAEAEAFAAHLATCSVCREELAEFENVVAALPMSAPRHPAPAALRQRVLEAVAAEPRTAPAARPERRRQARPWAALSRPSLALGLTAIIVVAVVLGLTLGGGSPHTRVYTAQVMGSAGTAKLAVTDGRAELIVRHMPPPPQGKIYEVWVARGHVVEPTAALFSVTRGGSADVAVPGGVRDVRVVMVTPEPAGGSRVPTHAPVIQAQLT